MGYRVHFLLTSLACLAPYLLYRIVTFYVTRRRISKLHQCFPPVKYPLTPFLFGLEFFVASIRAVKSNTYLQFIHQLYNEHGNTFTIQASYFSPLLIHTIEPANIKTVLATNFADYTAGALRRKSFAPLLGGSIFLSDGKEWTHSRALLRRCFAHIHFNDMPRFEKHVGNLIRAIPADGETSVDLARLFSRFSADLLTDFMFGESIWSLLHPGLFDARFITMFEGARDVGESRFRVGMFADLVPGQGKFRECIKWVHEFVDKHVDEALKSRQNDNEKSEKDERRRCFLQEIARLSDDKRVVRDELLTIFFAGRDSTAATLTNLFFELSRRRDVWQRLHQEVAQKLGGIPPSFSQLKEMTYLQQCVNETLRLYPVIPVNSRVAQRDTFLPVGGGLDGKKPVFVPKGSEVAYHIFAMQRRPDLWGKDAAEFNPERWTNEAKSSIESDFAPFNLGPRRCLGEQFALTEILYTVIRLTQAFRDIESCDWEPWIEELGVTCTSGNGAKVVMNPAWVV